MPSSKQAAVCQRKGGKRSRKALLASIRTPVPREAAASNPPVVVDAENDTMDTSTTLPPVELSASASKLQHFSDAPYAVSEDPSLLPTTIVDLNCLQVLFEGLRCTACRGGYLRLFSDSSKTSGFAVYVYPKCTRCDASRPGAFTSSRFDDSQAFCVNRGTVSSSLASGNGFTGLKTLCEFTNMPLMNERTYQDHADRINALTPAFRTSILENSVKAVRRAYGDSDYPNLRDSDVIDITVSYDGSWHTRGHTSNNGVGAVIDTRTGLVVDYHIMSRYCKVCATTGETKKKEGEDIYKVWVAEHKEHCTKKFDQTAGAMEIEAALVCWGRSERQNRMRYVSVISDGDCKTIKKINESKPYGDKIVEKKECVNHVSKRLGKGLRDVVELKKKLKITLGGRGVGKLTQAKMNKLQKYYTKAIRSSNSVEEMKKAIWATFYHCSSSDEKPMHESCPEGIDSWCFYKRAVARGEVPPSHTTKLGSFLSQEVAGHIEDVYIKMSDDNLLARCVDGETQNANESLHNLLWSRCPKTIFVSLKRLETSLAIGIGEFNQGSVATRIFRQNLGLRIENVSVAQGVRRDKRRIYFSDYAIDERNKVRKELREAAKHKEQQELLEQEEEREGERLYLSGGDLL